MPAFGKRRALGQHFLRDPRIIEEIASNAVEEARRTGCRALVEIGPGKGAITHPLLEKLSLQADRADGLSRIDTFTLVEKDRALAYEWRGIAAQQAPRTFQFSVKEGDFLDLPEQDWLALAPLAIASNLPYSAGTAILTRLARHPDKIPVMVLMFQAEVAARLRAEPGTKAWGSLSIWIQNQWDVRKLCSAPPRAFSPPPDVDSEVVILTRRATPRVHVPSDEKSQDLWESLLKAGFAHRRKMLRSGLPPDSSFRAALTASGIEPTQRAEALNWGEWARFFGALVKVQG
jgi:16S rRNA (adenine1518-N6/adenine1519-N6)-dimethyltransferase